MPNDFTTDLAVFPESDRGRAPDDSASRIRSRSADTHSIRTVGPPRHTSSSVTPTVRRVDAKVPDDRGGRRRTVRDDGGPRSGTSACNCCSGERRRRGHPRRAAPRILGTNRTGPTNPNFDASNRRATRGVRCAGPLDHARRLRGVNAAHREARPGPGHRVGRVPVSHRRHHDHVLSTAPSDLGTAHL